MLLNSNALQNEKLQPLVGEISWTKNLLILTKCKDALEREFYLLESKIYLGRLSGVQDLSWTWGVQD
jgi:hypothetical protein